jgi:predicted nucleic acid-binding protein
MGMTGLLDTNVALYLLGARLAEPLPAGSYGVSVITEMELLSWPSLTADEEREKRVQAQPNYGPALCALAVIDAGLGRKEEALREGHRAMELMPGGERLH